MFHWSELYPEDVLPSPVLPDVLTLYHSYHDGLARAGVWFRFELDQQFQYNMKAYFRKVRDEMAKKKTTPPVQPESGLPVLGYDAPTRWLNVYLHDEDAAFLSELDVTLDGLSANFVALGVDGWDISLKRREQDQSCMASAVQRDPFNPSGRVGVSAWSDNFPDAIAALLYKIHDKLAGAIPPPVENQSRRFR